MPDYRQEISSPSLDGLTVQNYNIDSSSSKGAVANAVTAAIATAAGVYGKNKAKKKGTEIAGTESYEEAGAAADRAKTELEAMFQTKEAEVGKPVTSDQARDLKKEVFDKVLVNYKRIEAALSRGVISSTEANARLSVLRNEALSNPLVAPYQDELDNALFKSTGGSATTFGATTAEQQAQAASKGELAAIQATEEKVSTYIQTGLAASRKQALSIIAQQAQHEANMKFYQEKKERLGVTSQEAYAASQTLATSQAGSAYSKITGWVASGADAKEVSSIRMEIIQEGEQIKQALRASATNNDGTLLVDQSTLRAQIDDVDQRTRDFSAMLDDQSATKDLVRIMAQRTAAMDYKHQDVQIELTRLAPLMMAMKDNQAASQLLWNNALSINEMRSTWLVSTNPLLKLIAKLSPNEAASIVNTVGEKTVKGKELTEDEQAVAAEILTNKGGTSAIQESYKIDPDLTVKQLSTTPFKLKDISNNQEWINLGRTEDGQVQIKAIVEGAARRAILSNFTQTRGKFGEGTTIPKSIKVTEQLSNTSTTSTSVLATGGVKQKVWDIDTGGFPVSPAYQSEVVNAYKLGQKVPALWQDDFPTVDDWINSLFTRNIKEEVKE